jgi:hypothetical protein
MFMSGMRRAAIYKLATAAQEAELDVMSGMLRQGDDGHWLVNGRSLTSWLAEHEGTEVVLVLGSLDDERPMQLRTCRTCGRDYMDLECPYCRANRIRLRGRA